MIVVAMKLCVYYHLVLLVEVSLILSGRVPDSIYISTPKTYIFSVWYAVDMQTVCSSEMAAVLLSQQWTSVQL